MGLKFLIFSYYLISLEKQYPEVYQMTKNLFYGFNIRLNQVNILGKENADLLNNRKILKILNPFISPYLGV